MGDWPMTTVSKGATEGRNRAAAICRKPKLHAGALAAVARHTRCARARSYDLTEEADARFEGAFSFAGVNAATSMVFDTVAAFDDSLQPDVAQPSYQGGSLGGLFSRPGLIGGFAAGFLGSGVIGVLFGHGAIGELSGVASILGLMFQLTLLVMLARLIWTWWRDDTADAFANLSPRQLADAYGHSRHEVLPDIDSEVRRRSA